MPKFTYNNCLYVSDKTKTDMVTCTKTKKKVVCTYMAVFYIPTQPVAKCPHDQAKANSKDLSLSPGWISNHFLPSTTLQKIK